VVEGKAHLADAQNLGAMSLVRSRWLRLDCGQRCSPARPRRPERRFRSKRACTAVTTQSLATPGIIIDGSKMGDAGDGLPKHCILSGEVSDRTGVDGKRPTSRQSASPPPSPSGSNQ
jgi:hypothetical protein